MITDSFSQSALQTEPSERLEQQPVPMKRSRKVRELEELAQIAAELRLQNKTVIHCHGVFDLMHVGHIRHFQQARAMGDVLIVTITPDRFVNKGPGRPVFTEDLRATAIAALECVDFVAINKWPMAIETIRLLRPDLFVKGAEFQDRTIDKTNAISLEENAILEAGGRMVFTDDGVVFSSSHLLNQCLSVLPSELQQYLSVFAANHRPDTVQEYLDRARDLRVLVVGEAVIDEYEYCEAIGKSGKEPIIVTRHVRNDRFLGGSLSVANQAAAFAKHVTLLTFLGDTAGDEHFIDSKLDPSIERIFLRLPGVSTITKKQFVQVYPMQKLFEVDVLDSKESFANHTPALCGRLREILPQYDVVIVSDHGHGMLGPEAVNVLCRGAKFLAVTTQMNADNHGFHTISKYPRADYISISENELRLEARSRTDDLQDIVRALSDELSCSRIVVIQGQQGCLCYSREQGFQAVPAFSSRIVDRKGATDSMLAVTALCAAQRAPIEVLGFVANAVGAQAVSVVGNPGPVTRTPLLRQVDCLLK